MAALTEAVFAIDARTGLVNLGTGGAALNPTSGSNPSGADSNDPLFLAHDGENYLYLPGVAGNYASAPDSAALSITGDIDIKLKATLADWTPSAINTLVSKYGAAGQISYAMQVSTDGTLQLSTSADGTNVLESVSTVATGVTDGATKWVRATMDIDNGSSQRVAKFYTSDDGTTWTQLGSTVTTAGATSIFDSTTQLWIGARGDSLRWTTGAIHRVIIQSAYDTADNTTALAFDADFTTGITSGSQTSFTESSSNAATVTINRSTSGRKAVAVVRPVWLFGTDDYLQVADNALLDFGASDSFTVLAVLRQWATPANNGRIVSKSVLNTTAGYTIRNSGTAFSYSNTVLDGVNTPAVPVSPAGSSGLLSAVAVQGNRTTQLATSFLNGTSGTAVSISSVGPLANSNPLRIGRETALGTSYADMELFAVAIWRRALSAAEIAAMSTALTNAVLNPGKPDHRGLQLATGINGLAMHTTTKGLVLS